ncbi:MAG: thioredoxin family protein [Acidobacteria bacterium]|nr:thioredoxin family protein [Acidobacteriota bacterium]
MLHAPRDYASQLDALPVAVRLVFFGQTFGCETCLQAELAIDEIARLSERVTVEKYNLVLDREQAAEYGIERAPAVAIVGDADRGLRYYGTPAGHEVQSLVDAILVAGGGAGEAGGLSAASLAAAAAVDRPVDIKVFVTTSCVYCPQVTGLAYRLAAASPHISAAVVEATEFPDMVQRYGVSGVPKTVVDDRVELLGVQPEETFVREVLQPGPDAPLDPAAANR